MSEANTVGLAAIKDIEKPRKRGRPPTPRDCGHCLFAVYSDADLINGQTGRCGRPLISGRDCITREEGGCGHWTRRIVEKRKKDEKRTEKLNEIINAVNAAVTKRRKGKR